MTDAGFSLEPAQVTLDRTAGQTPAKVAEKAVKVSGSLGIGPAHNISDLLMRFYERELEHRLQDVTLNEGPVTLYSVNGSFYVYYEGKTFDLDRELPVVKFNPDGIRTTLKVWHNQHNFRDIRKFLNRNYDALVRHYESGGRAPFAVHKSTTGLPRTIFFYSPSQIYLLENMSPREDVHGNPIGDIPVGFGGFKKVKTAIDLLTGEEVIFSSMSTEDREAFDFKHDRRIRIRGAALELLQVEEKARLPLKGVPHVIQTLASHTHESLKKGGTKVWTIERKYDGDLYATMEVDPATGRPRIELTHEEKLEVARQMIDGLRRIHETGIIHRDIKPDNILLRFVGTPEGGRRVQVVVSDLGLAAHKTNKVACRRFCGTLGYISPEYYDAGASHDKRAIMRATTEAIDWFAMGLTLRQLFCGTDTFSAEGMNAFSTGFSAANPDLHRLIEVMTSFDSTQRSWENLGPYMRAALSHS